MVFCEVVTNSAKRPLNGVNTVPSAGSSLTEMDLKRKKRLEKNREIAKNCRKRKKEKKEALEEEIARLQEENSRMRVQLQDETNDAERQAQRQAGLKRLRECYEAHDEEGIARESQRYYAEWEEFGRKRLMMAEFHLEQLKRLVLPTQVSVVMMW